MNALLCQHAPPDGTLLNVAIILVNYKQPAKTLQCLDSLKTLQGLSAQAAPAIIVVDNASGDNSISLFNAAQLNPQGLPFQLLQNHENLGFSGGVNTGLQVVLKNPDIHYVWLLNNDTTVAPDTLAVLLNESCRTGGIVGSQLRYPEGRFQQAGMVINLWRAAAKGLPEPSRVAPYPVDAISGASMLIPVTVLKKIGLLDAHYFLYFEDIAYCLKARRAGFQVTLAPASIVFHVESASTGKGSLLASYYSWRNRLLLVEQFGSPLQKITSLLYTQFRLFRSRLKAWLPGGFSKSRFLTVHQLAVSDYRARVSGPCPHVLTL
ncbi:MAG: glycosyltransferase family 2 protein [Vampirovibrionales bacterium]|nr:glycosyltransferase family 2 protein [Vampirovibrionales bacterium]